LDIWHENDRKQMIYLPESRLNVLSTLVTREENWNAFSEQFVTDNLTNDYGFALTHHFRYSLEDPNDLDRFMHLAKNSTEANLYRWWNRESSFLSWIIWINKSTIHFKNEADKKIFLRRLFDHVTTMAQDLYAQQLRLLLDESDSTSFRRRWTRLQNNAMLWLQSTQNKWQNAADFEVIHDSHPVCLLKLTDVDF